MTCWHKLGKTRSRAFRTVYAKSLNRGKIEKGAWWMPRLTEAKKDVVSCEKPRVGANGL